MRALLLLAVVATASAPMAHAREREPYPQFPKSLATAAAVHMAARLAHALRDPLTAESLDIPPDVIADARLGCLDAAEGSLPDGARAEALECAADLGAGVLPFLSDHTATLRATAVGLVGASARTLLTSLAAGDPEPEVAATALGLLCADDAARTVRDLDPAGRARVAALARDKQIDAGLAAHVALCLKPR